MATLKELRQIRIDKLQKIIDKGVNPYPAKSYRTNYTKDIVNSFETLNSKKVFVSGRIMAYRGHGKLAFMDLVDETGKIQLYIKQDNLNKKGLGKSNEYFSFSDLELLDIGDFVDAEGTVTKTQRGEISVEVSSIRLLTKSIRPIPTKWTGFTDIETRYRRRYLDMVINNDVREVLRKKGIFIQSMRNFMLREGFSEVETPILENVTGGAEATPFITKYNALDLDMYLRISLELPLKRLIAGGMEKVFEIGRVFRNEGVSMMHLQHYTQMEFYWAYADFEMLIDLIQKLYVHAIEETFGTLNLEWQGTKLDFNPPWPRIDYQEEFLKKTGIDLRKHYEMDDILKVAEKLEIEDIDKEAGAGRLIDQIYKKTIRPFIQQPSLLVNHPVIISPLSKRDDQNPNIVKRFQPVMLGAEVGNGWNELNDPIDQYNRFKDQQDLLDKGDDEAMMMDIDYIECLEYGMPPTAGFGVGFDRLFMYLADLPSIRDTLYFPIMRPRVGSTSQEIYGINVRVYEKLHNYQYLRINPNVSQVDNQIEFVIAKLSLNTDKAVQSEIEMLRRNAVDRFSNKDIDLESNKRIKAYRDIFKKIGLDLKKHVPRAEGLLRSVIKSKSIARKNDLIDIMNVASLEHGISIGVFDADKIEGNIEVRLSTGNERINIPDGSVIMVQENSICFYDEKGIMRANLNEFISERVVVDDNTKKIIVVVDKVEGIDLEVAERTMRHAQADLANLYDVVVEEIGIVSYHGHNHHGTDLKDNTKSTQIDPNQSIISIDQKVSEKLKALKVGYLLFEIDENSIANKKEFDNLREGIENQVWEKYQDLSSVKKSELIEGVRNVYKSFKVDPNKNLNSAEALIRRIVSGKGIYKINPIVDLYNITSAEKEIPMAAYDYSKVEGQISLRFSKEGEEILKIGETEKDHTKEGELVYADNKGLICLDYNYRDSNRTKITDKTRKFIVIIDGYPGIDEQYFADTIELLETRYKELLSAKLIQKQVLIAGGDVIEYDLEKDDSVKIDFENIDENKKRFTAVLNKEFNHGQLMNALAHMSSGLSSGLLDQKDIVLVDYLDKSDEMHAILSHYPYIILEAKNSNAILKLRKEAKEKGIKFIDFTDTMFVGSTKDQVNETHKKNEDELSYVGILMFGDTVQIKELTKKFSLLK